MKKIIFLSALLTILTFPCPLRAQDSVDVVVISKQIGRFINLSERNYFRLFPSYENFQLAYFTRDSADAYSIHVYHRDEKGLQQKDMPVKKTVLLTAGEKIDNYDKVIKGSYTTGSNPDELRFIRISRNEIENELEKQPKYNYNYSLVGESETDYKQFFPRKSWFNFSAGLTFTNFDFDELHNLTDQIDSYFNAREYSAHAMKSDYQVGPFYRFRGTFELTQNLSVAIIIDENFKSQSIKYDAVTIMGSYSFTDLLDKFVPFAGLGYTKNNFSTVIKYNNAEIDTMQGRLQSVSVDGGTKGFIAEAGIKFLLTDYFNIGIAADYYFLSVYRYETNIAGIISEIKPGNFGAEVFLTIKF